MNEDALRSYQAVRDRLEHEDGLVVQRLSWLLASQSFLFTAYAIVLNGIATGGREAMVGRMQILAWILPVLGMATCALIWAGIFAALRAMGRLSTEFGAKVPDPGLPGLPPLLEPAPIRGSGLAAPVALPLLFLAAWVLVLAAS